ncbi:UV DNA damage repair endonuclease UvsE [Sporomusa termitida]|uniref:UV DNA damage endonuclease n=1 Tax=Sporomusa termitida TaxID=2377 RepID=A0A517DUN6_9FIRM|nr:UV DNA damage repair endonuclease UvsE [Sporomusa termitida]QDR81071.1 UV DNA damage endonuclease [Sporomusa termitida]
MRIRFGYVAIALNIAEGSPNKSVTVKNLEKITDPEGRINRLRRLTRENLANTLRILRYNSAYDIHVYRLTSKTVPLATHPLANDWSYTEELKTEWREIGDYIQSRNMRISAHPDHYTLLNSPREDVLTAALADLDYHVNMLEAMRLPPAPQLVIHVGGLYKAKTPSLERFISRFSLLPDRIRQRLMIENDDKLYTAADVLTLCQTLGSPMVLDIHHHTCMNQGEDLAGLWPAVIKTWQGCLPKIHLSSPKNAQDIRSHADNINLADFLPFLAIAKETGHDFDVMIEAKNKDQALFKLLDELEQTPGVKRVEQAVIEL